MTIGKLYSQKFLICFNNNTTKFKQHKLQEVMKVKGPNPANDSNV